MDAIIAGFWTFLGYTWWFWLFIVLLPTAHDAWIAWRQKMYEHHIKWVFLELLIPRETLRSPQAMEQIFNQLYQLKNYPGDIKEYWWDGEVTLWHSFELVSMNGEIHLYLKTPKAYRDIVEAAIFAFYPDIEIVETEDYLKKYPPTIQELYRDGMTIWGAEMQLKKSAAYPIKSYIDFESPDENKQYDPISAFTELLAKLQPGQMAAVQYLVAPAVSPHDEHELSGYQDEVVKVRERKHEADHSSAGHVTAKTKVDFQGVPLPALSVDSHAEDPSVAGEIKKAILSRTPGETKTLEAMEENLARPMFNVIIRLLYISKTELFSSHFPRRSLAGAFNQFQALDMNGFARNPLTQTRGKIWEWPIIFPEIRFEFRRQRSYYDFRHREIPAHTFFGHALMRATFKFDWKHFRIEWGSKFIHLNTRSLATLFHPPTAMVLTGPHIKRVDSRKGGPPSGMAIFGDEDQIEKFK